MKFIRYSKFKGFDPFGINHGDLMQSLSDSLLDSGYNDDYWWTRRRNEIDDSLDALRQAILQALLEQGILDEHDAQKMLDENDGKLKGSLLEELINQLIERLVEEGYRPRQTVSRSCRRSPAVHSAIVDCAESSYLHPGTCQTSFPGRHR